MDTPKTTNAAPNTTLADHEPHVPGGHHVDALVVLPPVVLLHLRGAESRVLCPELRALGGAVRGAIFHGRRLTGFLSFHYNDLFSVYWLWEVSQSSLAVPRRHFALFIPGAWG